VLEHALFNAGIPYRVHGGLRFFERQEIKHALAYLRLIGNTDDDGALMRVINFPARGIGVRSLEQLQEIAKQNQSSLWQAAKSGQLGGKAGASIGAFLDLIRAMQDTCEGLPLPEQIEHMLAQSGLLAHYQAEKDGADRVDNLNELVNAAVGFVNEIEDDSLVAFLTHAALEAGEHQAGEGSDALQLMTVHAAKGLEFHAVFLSGLEEGLFPHDNARNEADGVEEERRLMYVAITRARRRLYLSLAQSRMLHGQFRYGLASRFLNEIPENLLKRINPAPKAYHAPEKMTWAPQAVPASSPATYGRDSSSPWHVGQNVAHAKFGSGVIVNCEGVGADARVQVKFRNAGVKWLALEYAKLTAT
jgi:DNA helicase-2/ATP-dependent DNA helicase PcrA